MKCFLQKIYQVTGSDSVGKSALAPLLGGGRIGLDQSHADSHVRKAFHTTSGEILEDYIQRSREVRLLNFGKEIYFYTPSFMYYSVREHCSSTTDFPTISVTGQGCALNCKHCSGKVLKTMYSASTAAELFRTCTSLKEKGASGCLISGGCLADGSVPLQKFTDAIKRVRAELDLTVIVHTGLLNFSTAQKLKDASVDAALIDIVGSSETIREICRLDATVGAYESSLQALSKACIPFVPHVIVGLHYGKLKGELNALRMIAKHSPSALVIIAFIPIHGTEMENTIPSSPFDITKVIVAARMTFPRTPIALGCMRPKGKHRIETDILAIRAGVNGIAFPTREAIEFAEELGHKARFSSLCCSQIYTELLSSGGTS